MWDRLREFWLPAGLFLACLGSALALALLVGLGPWLEERFGTEPLLVAFARDTIVRRTALFSALGLAVTAFVFFKPAPRPPRYRKPPSSMAGA